MEAPGHVPSVPSPKSGTEQRSSSWGLLCWGGGDARCDTPGHNAKFGSYILMHSDGDGHQGTRKIVSMKLVQVSEVIYDH